MKKGIAIFFIVIFTGLISAPAIILSIDNSIDTSVLLGLSEEEETESAKLLFENEYSNVLNLDLDFANIGDERYTHKKYTKPHLNLIFPPPDKVLC